MGVKKQGQAQILPLHTKRLKSPEPPMPPNLFDLPDPLPDHEVFTRLIDSGAVKIERIISTGQTTPAG